MAGAFTPPEFQGAMQVIRRAHRFPGGVAGESVTRAIRDIQRILRDSEDISHIYATVIGKPIPSANTWQARLELLEFAVDPLAPMRKET